VFPVCCRKRGSTTQVTCCVSTSATARQPHGAGQSATNSIHCKAPNAAGTSQRPPWTRQHRADSCCLQTSQRVPARTSPQLTWTQHSGRRTITLRAGCAHLQQLIEQGVQPVADEGAVGERDEPVNLRQVTLKLLLHSSTGWTRRWHSSYNRQRGGCIGGRARASQP
jgi:hypothetical protein